MRALQHLKALQAENARERPDPDVGESADCTVTAEFNGRKG